MNRGEIETSSRLEFAIEQPRHNTPLEGYLEYAQISLDMLQGRVLDLGSGDTELFSREASFYDIDVTSVDPNLVFARNRAFVREGQASFYGTGFMGRPSVYTTEPTGIAWQEKSVAALAQELPFKDGAFDTVISSGAIPVYLPAADLAIGVSEILRVLSPDGNAYLGPMADFDWESFRIAKFEAALIASGANYELKTVSLDDGSQFFSAHIAK